MNAGLPSDEVQVSEAWRNVDPGCLRGTVLVLGAAGTGKTTLVRWLVKELVARRRRVGWIDGDPGQSTLGVPGTMNLGLMTGEAGERAFPEATFFVGSTSPRGHMLPVLVGYRKLQDRALERNAGVVVVDTTGLVAPQAGGGALKEWLIELLRPQAIVAIQQGRELEHLLGALRRRTDLGLKILPPGEAVRRRSPGEREAYRIRRFREYFSRASSVALDTTDLPVYGLPKTGPGSLAALLDRDGFVLQLGVVVAIRKTRWEILLPSCERLSPAGVRGGDIRIDPRSGREIRL